MKDLRQFGVWVVLGVSLGIANRADAQPVALDLGTLGGTYSQTYDVNASGQIVGFSYTAGNAASHAFSWTAGGGMRDLRTLGGSVSQSRKVNDKGQVVGVSFTAGDAEIHPFLWTAAGGMMDL